MALQDGSADLHLHTTASDGTCGVADRVEQARERDLATIAVTDHDCIAPELGERVTRWDGVEVVTGVEVRADVDDTKVEILGYYVDPDDGGLQDALETARSARRDRNRALVDAVASETGLDLDYETLRAEADGMLGRPHVASALLEAGEVDSIGAAFEEYLGADGSAYVPMERAPASQVVEAIQGAGGVASLAHPGRIRSNDVDGILEELLDAGLDAIEVDYPYDEAPDEGYAAVDVERAREFSTEYGLLRTGGSDCHGPGSGKFRIGEVRVESEHVAAVRDRADERRPL